MKILSWGKDGGPESKVWGFWFCEFKNLFSIVLLKFEDGTREAYHTHAFNCISWVLKGTLIEKMLNKNVNLYYPSPNPIITTRDTFHQVESVGTTWVFSIRGPWSKTWYEYLPNEDKLIKLTNGRKEVTDI